MGRDWTRKSIEELIDDEVYAMIKSGEIPTGGGAPAVGSVWDSMITFRHGARVIQRDPVTRISSGMRLSMFNKNTYYSSTGSHLFGIVPAGSQKYNEGLIYNHHPGFDSNYYYTGTSYVGAELDFESRDGLKFFGLKVSSGKYTFPWSTPKVWIFSEDISADSGAAEYPITVWIRKYNNQLTIFDDVPPALIVVGSYSLTEDLATPSTSPISGATVSIANPVCHYAFMAYDQDTDTNYLENTLFNSSLISSAILLSIPNEYGAYIYNITDDEILKLVYPGQDNITVQHVSLGYGV